MADYEEDDYASEGEDEDEGGDFIEKYVPLPPQQEEEEPPAKKVKTDRPPRNLINVDAEMRKRCCDLPSFEDFLIKPENPVVVDPSRADLEIQIVDQEIQLMPRYHEYDDPDVKRYLEKVAGETQDFHNMQSDYARNEGWGRRFSRPPVAAPSFIVPCSRIYGRLRDGRSVCVNAFGYYPTVHLRMSCDLTPRIVDETRAIVEGVLKNIEASKRYAGWKGNPNFRYVLDARPHRAYLATPYDPKPYNFLAFKLASIYDVKQFGDYFHDHHVLEIQRREISVKPYSCINTNEMFMADLGLAGFGWVRLPKGRWSIKRSSAVYYEDARVDFEVRCNYLSLVPFHDDSIAPLRNVTFDLEMAKTQGMPTYDKNPIITISAVCGEYVNGAPGRKRRVLLHYGTSEPSDYICPANGDRQISFSNELSMLNGFGSLLLAFNPDFIAGHNIMNFDIPYLVQRAHLLQAEDSVQFLGRRCNYEWKAPRRLVKTRKNGEAKEVIVTDTPGIIQLDTLPWIKAIRKLRSYGLGFLSTLYLGKSKLGVSYTMITPLWVESDASRKRLVDYNMVDSIRDDELIDHKEFNMITSAVEMARQTRVPASKLLRSGQQAKVWGVLLEKFRKPNWGPETDLSALVPYERPAQRNKDDKFAGAVVIQPERGFYTTPVVCCDFMSLYPSIIREYNICFGTMVPDEKMLETLPHHTSPCNTHFVDASVRKGVLPQLEEELMAARGVAKKLLAAETDPAKKRLYDSRQNEIKGICNSAYGVLTASGGRLVRICLGLSVTSWGKKLIYAAKEIAETRFNGRVVYGGECLLFFPILN